MDNPLKKYFDENDKLIIHKWAHYFDIYHKHFQCYVGKECVVLEIGVFKGGSLQMWKDYFGERAQIYGVDINPDCKKYEDDSTRIFVGSQSDRNFLEDLKSKIPKIDILVDDGGHTMEQQITAFEILFDHIKDGGLYLCEDTHTSYWDEYGGGLSKPGTFLEFTKSLIDKLHAWHIRDLHSGFSDLTQNMDSLHFYDSIFIVEKKRRTRPLQVMSGVSKDSDKYNSVELFDLFKLKLSILGIDFEEYSQLKDFPQKSDKEISALQQKFEGKVWPDTGVTMIGYKRLSNIEYCLRLVLDENIEGDVIETGVWRGGACIFMRAILKIYVVTNKNVWVADSFEGLPEPNLVLYPADKGDLHHTESELAVSLEEVKENFRKYDLLDGQVKFLKGWFKDTIPLAPIKKLSILRLDGDMYESTIDVLYHLYPKLSIGGFCIVDDWGAVLSCKKAIEDYRNAFGIDDEIHIIDWTGIYWRKVRQVPFVSRKHFFQLITANIPE